MSLKRPFSVKSNYHKQKPGFRKDNEDDKKGVVYIGHMPKGFEENEMQKYFKQFGKVKRLKVSRSVKTGSSKGYAFIQFENEEVARIAAETMNNYIMFKKSLKAHVIEPEKVSLGMFKGCHRTFVPCKRPRRALTLFNNPPEVPSTEAKHKRKRKDMGRVKKLTELGYEFPSIHPVEKSQASPQSTLASQPAKISTAKTPESAKKIKLPVKVKKSVSLSEELSTHSTEEDDEITFNTTTPLSGRTVKQKKVFPKTPIPKTKGTPVPKTKSTPVPKMKGTPVPKTNTSTKETPKHKLSETISLKNTPSTLKSSAKKTKSPGTSEASPALPAKSAKKRLSTPATQQPMKTPSKFSKISPRVTRSAHKKRKSMI